MDLGMSYDRVESFRLFQARILEEYDKMVDTDNFVVLDGTLPVNSCKNRCATSWLQKSISNASLHAFRNWSDHVGTGKGENRRAIASTETPAAPPQGAAAKTALAAEEVSSNIFLARHCRIRSSEITGSLIVIEGMDGSGRSTQIALLQEWLESEGFAVQTSGLRRSNLVGRDIDELLAKNAATRLTLALMYATDFFDQVEHRILPALRSGTIVLADRFIFTLIARGVVRGINRDYMSGLYAMALRPHLTFWLNVRPETAFGREFKKAQAISYWEAGRDMSLSHDLYWSFIRYQTMISANSKSWPRGTASST